MSLDFNEDVIEFTHADVGNHVSVEAGQVFDLRLPENPDHGERWAFVEHAGAIILEDHHDQIAPEAGRVFRLQVLGGESHLILHRAQVWDPMLPPEDTFDLHLIAS